MSWDKQRYASDPEYREWKLTYWCNYRKGHREEIRKIGQRHYWGNREEINLRRRRESQCLLRKAEIARRSIARKYGLSPQEHDAMKARQEGLCAICKKRSMKRPLCVDHCHATRKVRGLLCARCNMGIGLLNDDPQILAAAKSYLEAHHHDAARAAKPKARSCLKGSQTVRS